MTALACLWTPEADRIGLERCDTMLAAQDIYGRERRDRATFGAVAIGRNLHRTLPEDAFDQQPMIGRGGTLMMVADARLDTRSEVAEALGIDRTTLATMADSAVLLAAWERWGEAALPRLVGAFALIVMDRIAQKLTFARDVGGERPLFWHRDRQQVAIASMPAGLLALPSVTGEPDLGTMERLLGFEPPTGRRSCHAGIERVLPGEVVTVDRSTVSIRVYRKLEVRSAAPARFEERVEAFREHLDRATTARLRGVRGTVATHLSGGWDSAAVTGTAARILSRDKGRVLALTSVPRRGAQLTNPSGRFVDETAHASVAAAMFDNVEHVLVPGRARSPIADLDRWRMLYNRPARNLCNQLWFSRIRDIVRERGINVVLTGEVGNYTITAAPTGLLADYVRRGDWRGWARESIGTLRDGRARLRGVLASSFSPWIPEPLWRRLKPLSLLGSLDQSLLLLPAAKARLIAARRDQDRLNRDLDVPHAAAAALAKTDPGARRKGVLAGWGIDERDPTEDTRLAEFMLSLPPDMFLCNGKRRPLARAALSDRVPRKILDEKRKGLQATDWHEGFTADRANVAALVERLSAHSGFRQLVDVEAMRLMVNDWPGGNWESNDIYARYRLGLLNALSVGHFMLDA